jgi:tetratricopeptide (TPR) repeat protein
VAAKISGSTREEITRKIFYYVDSVLSYHIYLEQDRGAKKALKDGKGDCTEYSELMITLCRAKQIPARIVEGLIPSSGGAIGYHNWVEVFFPQYGWVSFDPTWADHPNSSTTFDTMKNSYIQLGYKRYFKHWFLPCWGSIPFSVKLKDSCIDLRKNFVNKIGLAQKYYNIGELDKASVIFDTLIKNDSDNYHYLGMRGMIAARKGDFKAAEVYVQKSVNKAQTSFEKSHAYYALSNYYALRGEGEAAVKALREALSMGFENYEHLYKDADFGKIKDYQPFIDLIKELKEKKK